jgi:hypothetical protein
VRRAACLGVVLAVCLFAQSGRDAYRASYRAWREADPMLERDAAAEQSRIADRASREASLVAKYGMERTDYLQQLAAQDETSTWLGNPTPVEPPPSSVDGVAYVRGETALLSRNIDNFANDPDKGIQLLRGELEHERSALTALSEAIAERQKAADAAGAAAAEVEQVRMKALREDRDLAAGLTQMAGQFHQETEAWAGYYRSLEESMRNAAPPSAIGPAAETPGNSAEASPGASAAPGGAVNTAAPNAIAPNTIASNTGAPNATAPRAAPAGSRPIVSSVPSLPLVRYTGAWAFPAVSGLYHGTHPEFIELFVNEENGHVKGTVFGRFKLPPGSTGDPVLRLTFEGDFKNTRNQTFDLQTISGAKGTIELIPGPGFNLLEVNIRTDPKPGQIAQVNALLIKK